MEGLEPSRSKGSTDFKSVASTNSATTPLELFLLFRKYTEKSKILEAEFDFYVKNFQLNSRFSLGCKERIKKTLVFFFTETKARDTKVFLYFPYSFPSLGC